MKSAVSDEKYSTKKKVAIAAVLILLLAGIITLIVCLTKGKAAPAPAPAPTPPTPPTPPANPVPAEWKVLTPSKDATAVQGAAGSFTLPKVSSAAGHFTQYIRSPFASALPAKATATFKFPAAFDAGFKPAIAVLGDVPAKYAADYQKGVDFGALENAIKVTYLATAPASGATTFTVTVSAGGKVHATATVPVKTAQTWVDDFALEVAVTATGAHVTPTFTMNDKSTAPAFSPLVIDLAEAPHNKKGFAYFYIEGGANAAPVVVSNLHFAADTPVKVKE